LIVTGMLIRFRARKTKQGAQDAVAILTACRRREFTGRSRPAVGRAARQLTDALSPGVTSNSLSLRQPALPPLVFRASESMSMAGDDQLSEDH